MMMTIMEMRTVVQAVLLCMPVAALSGTRTHITAPRDVELSCPGLIVQLDGSLPRPISVQYTAVDGNTADLTPKVRNLQRAFTRMQASQKHAPTPCTHAVRKRTLVHPHAKKARTPKA